MRAGDARELGSNLSLRPVGVLGKQPGVFTSVAPIGLAWQEGELAAGLAPRLSRSALAGTVLSGCADHDFCPHFASRSAHSWRGGLTCGGTAVCLGEELRFWAWVRAPLGYQLWVCTCM